MTYGERSDRVLMPFECGDLIRQRLLSAGATPTAAAPTPFPTAALPTATAECMSAIPRASLTPALPEHVSARCGVTPTRGGALFPPTGLPRVEQVSTAVLLENWSRACLGIPRISTRSYICWDVAGDVAGVGEGRGPVICGGGGRSQPRVRVRVRVGRRFFTARLFERYFNSRAMRIGGGEAAQALMLDIHSADSAGPSGHSTHASAVGDSGCTRNACS